MRSFPSLLKEIIAEEFHFNLTDADTLRLIESKVNLSVDIKIAKNDNIFCFSIDKDRDSNISKGDYAFPFLNPKVEGLCIKNDFILVYQKGKQIYVFLIELKSKNEGNYLKQLRAGKMFFDFILERIKLCNLDPNFKNLSNKEILYKGILFLRETPDKGTSKHKKLTFTNTEYLPITRQSYDNVYYMSQFL